MRIESNNEVNADSGKTRVDKSHNVKSSKVMRLYVNEVGSSDYKKKAGSIKNYFNIDRAMSRPKLKPFLKVLRTENNSMTSLDGKKVKTAANKVIDILRQNEKIARFVKENRIKNENEILKEKK